MFRINLQFRSWYLEMLRCCLVMGGGILVCAIAIHPAAAQNNQSDNTGPNVSDVTGPNVTDFTGASTGSGISGTGSGSDSDPRGAQGVDPAFRLDPKTAEAASEFAQALEDAYAKCVESTAIGAATPRRFARGVQTVKTPCITAECAQLNRLMSEVRAFIASLDRAQAEILRRSFNRLW